MLKFQQHYHSDWALDLPLLGNHFMYLAVRLEVQVHSFEWI
jgi:hypothetical protein